MEDSELRDRRVNWSGAGLRQGQNPPSEISEDLFTLTEEQDSGTSHTHLKI